MHANTTSTKKTRKAGVSPRITRSISFHRELLRLLRIKAKQEKRSVNYLVNEMIARQLA